MFDQSQEFCQAVLRRGCFGGVNPTRVHGMDEGVAINDDVAVPISRHKDIQLQIHVVGVAPDHEVGRGNVTVVRPGDGSAFLHQVPRKRKGAVHLKPPRRPRVVPKDGVGTDPDVVYEGVLVLALDAGLGNAKHPDIIRRMEVVEEQCADRARFCL